MPKKYIYTLLSATACSLILAFLFSGCLRSDADNSSKIVSLPDDAFSLGDDTSDAFPPEKEIQEEIKEEEKKTQENTPPQEEQEKEEEEKIKTEDLSQEDMAHQLNTVWGPNPYAVEYGLEYGTEDAMQENSFQKDPFFSLPEEKKAPFQKIPPKREEKETPSPEKELPLAEDTFEKQEESQIVIPPQEEKEEEKNKEEKSISTDTLYNRILEKIQKTPQEDTRRQILQSIIVAMENTPENIQILISLQEELPAFSKTLDTGILLLTKNTSPENKKKAFISAPENQ